MNTVKECAWSAETVALSAELAAVLAAGLLLCGCGMPGAPLPPSLNLPDPVTDLAATRTGDQVSLAWTMPRKNTDKLLLKGNVQARVCRREGASDSCAPAASLQLAPGADGAFTETLPPALAAGTPRALAYFVELRNSKGRSAGLSNAAAVLAGGAPEPVDRAECGGAQRRSGAALDSRRTATGCDGDSAASQAADAGSRQEEHSAKWTACSPARAA